MTTASCVFVALFNGRSDGLYYFSGVDFVGEIGYVCVSSQVGSIGCLSTFSTFVSVYYAILACNDLSV